MSNAIPTIINPIISSILQNANILDFEQALGFSSNLSASANTANALVSPDSGNDNAIVLTPANINSPDLSLTNAQKSAQANLIISSFTDILKNYIPLNFTTFENVQTLSVAEFLSNFATPEQIQALGDAVTNLSVKDFLTNFGTLEPLINSAILDRTIGSVAARIVSPEDLARLDPAITNLTVREFIRLFAGFLPSEVVDPGRPLPPPVVADPGPVPAVPVAPTPPVVVADPGVRPAVPVAPVAPIAPVAPPVVANPGARPELPEPVGDYFPPKITYPGGPQSIGIPGFGGYQLSLAQAQNLLVNGTSADFQFFGTNRTQVAQDIAAFPARDAEARTRYDARVVAYNADLARYNIVGPAYDASLAAYNQYLAQSAAYTAAESQYRLVDQPRYAADLAAYNVNLAAFNSYDAKLTAFTNYQAALATYTADLAAYQTASSIYQTVTLPAYTQAKANYDAYVIALAEYNRLYPPETPQA